LKNSTWIAYLEVPYAVKIPVLHSLNKDDVICYSTNRCSYAENNSGTFFRHTVYMYSTLSIYVCTVLGLQKAFQRLSRNRVRWREQAPFSGDR